MVPCPVHKTRCQVPEVEVAREAVAESWRKERRLVREMNAVDI